MRPFEGAGLWVTGIALLAMAAVDVRLAMFSAIAVAYFSAYSMLQFQRRHTFHLDIFSAVAAVFVLQVAATTALRMLRRNERRPVGVRRDEMLRAMVRVLGFAAAVTIVSGGILFVARRYQQPRIERLITTTLG